MYKSFLTLQYINMYIPTKHRCLNPTIIQPQSSGDTQAFLIRTTDFLKSVSVVTLGLSRSLWF